MDRIGEKRILKFLSLRTEAGAGESMCSRPPGGISNNYFMNGTTTLPGGQITNEIDRGGYLFGHIVSSFNRMIMISDMLALYY